VFLLFCVFNATAPTYIYTLSLHDALPIWLLLKLLCPAEIRRAVEDIDLERLWDRGIRAIILDLDNTLAEVHSLEVPAPTRRWVRSEEHTSELQSRENLVCRLLLEKKKQK